MLLVSHLLQVVDASTFLGEFEKRNKVQQRPDLGADDFSDQNNRQVVDLMCEQIECADVLVVNKVWRAYHALTGRAYHVLTGVQCDCHWCRWI